MLKDMCQAQCSNDEIAAALRVSWDTLDRRYAEAIKVWRGEGTMSARRRLFQLGMREDPVFNKDGEAIGSKPASVPALIFFLKNYGGMSDVTRNEEPLTAKVSGIGNRDSSATKTAGVNSLIQ